MALTWKFRGFDYVSYYNGAYENDDSLPALVATGANAIETTLDWGIDPLTNTVYADSNFTDPLSAEAAVIKQAVGEGLQVMVKPSLDFLNSADLTGTPYSVGDWRTYYNPGPAGSAGANAFFASYKTMLLQEASVAVTSGATMLSIGTELDQIAGPAYKSYWDGIISALRAQDPSLKLTYAADWNDAASPWQWGGSGLSVGTGDFATQISFASELDYLGVDAYAPLSNATDPTLQQLINGWTQTPVDSGATAETYDVTGNQSLIQYFEQVAAEVGKPLLFTEVGYENASDAASTPAVSYTGVEDDALQARLYQALFQAFSQSNDSSLDGAFLWNWDPNTSEVGPGSVAFSPQNLPALSVVDSFFAPNPVITSAGGLFNQGQVTVGGTLGASGANLSVSIYSAGTYIGATTAAADGTFSVNVNLPASGLNAITVQATDGVGNTGISPPVNYIWVETAADFVANKAAIDAQSSIFNLTDTAADVAAHIDALNGDSHVGTITLTDSGLPVLNLTAAQQSSDLTALADIANSAFEVVTPGAAYSYYHGGTSASALSSTLANSNIVEEPNSYLTVWGANDAITLGASDTLSPAGANEAISAMSGDAIWMGTTTGDVFTGAGFSLNAGSGASFSIGGNAGGAVDNVSAANATISVRAGGKVALWAAGDVITAGNGATVQDVAGGTVNVGVSTGVTITGGGLTINASSGASFSVGGSNDTVVGAGLNVTVAAGASVQVFGSGDTITSLGGATIAPQSNNETIHSAAGDNIWLGAVTGDVITGANFNAHVTSGTNITVGDNGTAAADVVAGSGATVTVQANATVTFWGASNQIVLGANVTLAPIGNNDTISAVAGDAIWLGGVTGDQITGAGFSVNAGSGASLSIGGGGASGAVDTAAGSNVAWTLLSGSNATFWGGGDQITSQGQSNYRIYGANDTIAAGAGDGISLSASADVVTAASNDSIYDLGSGSKIDVGSNIGTLGLSDFKSDPTGIIDLLNGVGGYQSSAAAAAALTSDGAGGALLSLGIDGSIDFKGSAPVSLGATHFKIG